MLRKNKSVWLVLLVVLLIVFCGVRLYRVQAAQKNYINSNVPTLFFHGWGSSYRAERQMANYAKNKDVTNTIIRADVSAKGEVELIGNMKNNARNPIDIFPIECPTTLNFFMPYFFCKATTTFFIHLASSL